LHITPGETPSHGDIPTVQQLWWPMPPGCAGIDDFISFYDPEWVDRGIELAPLHMGLRLAPYEFPRLRRDTFSGRPPLLADARPDKFGNALVNCWMAGQVVAPADITPLDRLGYAADHVLGPSSSGRRPAMR
jgi:serine/threonine-protein kinase HipA